MKREAETSSPLLARLDRLPFSPWHRNLVIVAFCGVLFDAIDFAVFGAALPSISEDFALGPAQAGTLATVGLLGAFLGALFWGTISDYIGRRRAFSATIGIFAAFTGLIAASWNLSSLAAARFAANFGLGGEIPVATTLVSEYMPRSVRGRATGLMLAAFPLGLVAAALLGLLLIPAFGWRAVFLVGVVPALLLFFVRRHVPESVRFLVSKGRTQEAQETVDRIEALAGLPDSAAVRGSDTAERALTAQPGDEEVPRVTVLGLLGRAHVRRTTLLWIVSVCCLWASNGLLFMLPTILTERGFSIGQAIGFQLVQAGFGVFGYASCAVLIDRYGRRPVLFLYYLVGAVFHLWFAVATGAWMYVAIAAVGWVNPGAYGATAVYASELYPTRMRATAVGWFFGVGRVGSFLAPLVIGLMLAGSLGPYALHTFAVAYLVGSIALLAIGIETKGASLDAIQEEVLEPDGAERASAPLPR